jgi:hypothetical protein
MCLLAPMARWVRKVPDKYRFDRIGSYFSPFAAAAEIDGEVQRRAGDSANEMESNNLANSSWGFLVINARARRRSRVVIRFALSYSRLR